MTNAELIQAIRKEIERRITDNTFGAKLELIDILAWLDTLESEKPINQDEELNEERALKAYPDVLFPFTPLDLNAYRREAFINDYEAAEKDLADKAKYSSGWDGFFYGKGYEQAEKDIKELIQYKIDSIGNNRERGYWLDAASELSDIIDMIDG